MAKGIGTKPLTRLGLTRTSRFRQTLLYPEIAMSFGLWSFGNMAIPSDLSDGTHTVQIGEEFRWDLISYRKYQTPYLWWVLCLANKVMDPFVTPAVGEQLRIPTIGRINRLLITDRRPISDRPAATSLLTST